MTNMIKIIYLWFHVHVFVHLMIKTFTPPDKRWKNRNHVSGLLHLQLSSCYRIKIYCVIVLVYLRKEDVGLYCLRRKIVGDTNGIGLETAPIC